MFLSNILWSSLTLLGFFVGCQATEQTVTLSATAGHPIPTTLWGQTSEEINGGDGGLYAELLQNRAFQQVTPGTPGALAGWHPVGSAQLNVIAAPVPVSSALPNALELKIPDDDFGPIGFGNEGYSGGLKVNTAITYQASFYYRFPTVSPFRGNAVVGFQTAGGLSLGTVNVAISGAQTTWLQVSLSIKPVQTTTNDNNYFSITVDGIAAAGETIHFAMLSLFPPTFNSRPNGIRSDLAAAFIEMSLGFLRFPGGKNLGNTINSRWQWNNTVGKLVDRPGRPGTEGYVATDGLGLFEFLQFCEDTGATPIMGIWAGFALDGSSIPARDLTPYIQQAIDQINFVIGPTNAGPGLLRAQLGHPFPFPLTYVEIGNEEFFSSSTYAARWRFITTTLSQSFPQLRYIATSNTNDPVLAPDPTHWDVHMYNTPGWFAKNSFYYDSFERNGTLYLEGAFAAVSEDELLRRTMLPYPTMLSALSEAAFMTGLERNSDIVFGASYSPLFNRIGSTSMSPSLISFDNSKVYRSISFYVHKMFSLDRGSVLMPCTLPNPDGTLFWSVSKNINNQFIFKVVNLSDTPEVVTFMLPNTISTGVITVLAGPVSASNNPTTPDVVVPVITSVNLGGSTTKYTLTAAPFSFSTHRMV